MTATRLVLEANKLTKRFGRFKALVGAGLSVRSSEVLGLIGPNGAGKTTLLECICGLQGVESGTVLCDGRQISPSHRRSMIFYVPENVVPYPEQMVRQVLTFYCKVYRGTGCDFAEVVDRLCLTPVLKKKCRDLSKGWHRRLLIAIGLLSPHPILLLDEPFDGLDLRQTRQVMAVLREEAKNGRALVISVHQLTDAQRACDRFVLLSEGTVAGEGTLAELQAQAGIKAESLEEVFLALS